MIIFQASISSSSQLPHHLPNRKDNQGLSSAGPEGAGSPRQWSPSPPGSQQGKHLAGSLRSLTASRGCCACSQPLGHGQEAEAGSTLQWGPEQLLSDCSAHHCQGKGTAHLLPAWGELHSTWLYCVVRQAMQKVEVELLHGSHICASVKSKYYFIK